MPPKPSVPDACSQCTAQQQKGLDFSQAKVGVSIFGGLKLGGGCAIGKWGGGRHKRDFTPRGTSLDKRTFGGLPHLPPLPKIGGIGGGGGGGGGVSKPL